MPKCAVIDKRTVIPLLTSVVLSYPRNILHMPQSYISVKGQAHVRGQRIEEPHALESW